jgi:hypothetical protein
MFAERDIGHRRNWSYFKLDFCGKDEARRIAAKRPELLWKP